MEEVYLKGAELEQARQELRRKLAEEFGVVGHPREEQLFELAWDFGHAYGNNEVRIFYDQMSVLLKQE